MKRSRQLHTMTTDKHSQLITSIKADLNRASFSPNRGASIGLDLFLARAVDELPEAQTAGLLSTLSQRLAECETENLLVNRLEYALRMAAPGQLEYEEVSKLFSVCNEIHALTELGFEAPKRLSEEFEAAVRGKLASIRRISSMVAHSTVADWNRDLWWYKVSMTKTRS